ncbi:hypothetical protein LOCC1_G006173, partial [Lachnellula occidentalis]
PALNTLMFSKYKSWFPDTSTTNEGHAAPQKERPGRTSARGLSFGGPASQAQGSTTSFLTATTLIYAIGAGITAAAGRYIYIDPYITQRAIFQLQLPFGSSYSQHVFTRDGTRFLHQTCPPIVPR